MTDEQKHKLLETIRSELQKVDAEIVRLEETTKPIAPENAIGRVSRMDAIGNKMINDQVLATTRTRKMQLETALTQSDAPDFGLCLGCMMPISIDRFLAIPEATLCVRCASR